MAAAVLASLVLPPSRAQGQAIRLSVSNWKIEAGDSYTLSWMERGGVQTYSDFTLEEANDPQFKDNAHLVTYIVRAHHKKLENTPSFSHGVRYYRIRARRGSAARVNNEQVSEEVLSNVVRVTLLGTNNAVAAPSFPDDPRSSPPRRRKTRTTTRTRKEGRGRLSRHGPAGPHRGEGDHGPAERPGGTALLHPRHCPHQGVVPCPPARIRVSCEAGIYTTEIDTLKPRYTVDGRVGPLRMDKPGRIKVHVDLDPDEKIPESRKGQQHP